MVANPLYGREPDVDGEQLRALRLVPRGEWRGPGCGDRCARVFAERMGGGGREIVEAHDGAAHEAYVHSLYVPQIVRTGCLTVDLDAGRLWVNEKEATRFKSTAWKIVETLARHCGAVVSHEEIWAGIHGDDVPMLACPSYISAAMDKVRKFLGPAASLVETRMCRGYMLRAEPPIGPCGAPVVAP